MVNNFYEVTVPQGEDIKKILTAFILQQGWKNVYVTGAIGSVIDMVFTTPVQNHLPLRCGKVPVSAAGEIVQFCGEVMPIKKCRQSWRIFIRIRTARFLCISMRPALLPADTLLAEALAVAEPLEPYVFLWYHWMILPE